MTTTFTGELLHPDDDGYDEARTIWNAMIDRRPALIARCASTEDVIAALELAAAEDLEVSVRGGGHSIPGHSVIDGALMIDLSPLNQIQVDAAARTAVIGGGALLGDVDQATQQYGLAVAAGAISHTGAGGLILGGGLGWTMRKYGLTIDALIGARIVTADGQDLWVDGDNHPDLFWALRGGGGNFGVVTEFHVRLHPRGPVLLTMAVYDIPDAAQVLTRMAEVMPTAHRDLVWSAFFRLLPPFPWAPAHRHGTPVLLAPLAWLGDDLDEGHALIQSLTDSIDATPLAVDTDVVDYLTLQSMNDELNGHGLHNYHKSAFLAELDAATIETLVTQGAAIASENSQLEVLSMGGAIDDVHADDTAFAGRTQMWPVNVCGIWRPEESRERNLAWVRGTFDALGPYRSAASYLNFGGSDADQDASKSFGAHNWERLRTVKTTYDPDNRFRFNANIPPYAKTTAEHV